MKKIILIIAIIFSGMLVQAQQMYSNNQAAMMSRGSLTSGFYSVSETVKVINESNGYYTIKISNSPYKCKYSNSPMVDGQQMYIYKATTGSWLGFAVSYILTNEKLSALADGTADYDTSLLGLAVTDYEGIYYKIRK